MRLRSRVQCGKGLSYSVERKKKEKNSVLPEKKKPKGQCIIIGLCSFIFIDGKKIKIQPHSKNQDQNDLFFCQTILLYW